MEDSPGITFTTIGSDGHEFFNGYIDDVREYDSVLTGDEVQSLADGNEDCSIARATPTPAPVSQHHSGSSSISRINYFVAANAVTNPAQEIKNPGEGKGNGAPVSFSRDLQAGSSGNDVKQIQIFLNSHGFPVAATGSGSLGNETNYFGIRTRAALAKFQKAKDITPAAGYLGPKTKAFILSIK